MVDAIIETVVCSPAQGKDARLLRMLNARQEFKRQKSGCLAAWHAKSSDGEILTTCAKCICISAGLG